MEERYTVRRPIVNAAQLQKGMHGLPRAMKMMGFSEMRAGQDQVVCALMAGRDAVVVLPTSLGKTACFTLPTLALNKQTLVISPLIALMQDQVQNPRRKGVRAGCINSHNQAMNAEYIKDWISGNLEILVVAPERLRREDFMDAMRHRRPWMVCVDEAHCLSAWSMTFRSAYCVVGDFISELNPEVVASFTATCPPEVEADIRRVMCIEKALKIVYYPRRTNLDLRSSDLPDLSGLYRAIERVNGPVIMYCATTKHTESLALSLQELSGKEVGFYHGKMAPDKRSDTQNRFMQGDMNIICSTNAFGMGVDKSNVRGVFHYDMPGTVENLAQELGRAGRDGKYSLCMTYYSGQATRTQRFLNECSNPSVQDVRAMYEQLRVLAGDGDIVHMSVQKIAEAARLQNTDCAYAVMQVLQGSLVVERNKATEKQCNVRFLNRLDDTRFENLRQGIISLGDLGTDEYYKFDLLGLATELDLRETTVRAHLNSLAKSKVIEFVPPERAAPTKIIGDESMIDFERVQKRKDDADAKLEEVIFYTKEVPDADKHAFLEKYFCVEGHT